MPQSLHTQSCLGLLCAPHRRLAFSLGLALAFVAVLDPVTSLAAQVVEPRADGAMPRIQLLAAIRSLSAEIAGLESAAGAPAIAARLPSSWSVVAGDERIAVSADWLIAALTAAPATPEHWPATRALLVRRLTGMGDEIESAGDVARAEARAQARSAIEAILAQSEFQQSAASKWRDGLQERVGKWLEDLMSRFGGGRGAARNTVLALAWAAALGALIGVGFWMARTIADRERGTSLGLGSALATRPRARELALRAVAAARAGNARDAVRCAYGAALARLEEQGVWRIDDARTPREYLPMLSATDSRHSAMLDLTRRFEQVWYGNRAAVADDVRSVTDHLEVLGCLRPGERAI